MHSQDEHIERLNYFRDPRVNPRTTRVVIEIEDPETGEGVEIELPTKWVICNICNGEGRHVNPSIDAGGISSDEFLEDPDFAEDYFSGTYDVSCNACNGSGKVRVPDYDQLTEEQREALEEQQMADAAYEAERRAELIMGA